ncbi:MAG: hypothetical protein GQ527_07770 [Bacteroidales bacterium]|nr:hypothetical protein [Bacteroidales bacterium]
MKAASIKEIKQELANRPPNELLELCLRLSRFKKENKELLTYLLYEASDEEAYIKSVKSEIEKEFKLINTKTYYFIKKSVRKILRSTKKYIRYSKKKETEVELLIFFCAEMNNMEPSMEGSIALHNIFKRQIESIKKMTLGLHEDLQYDFQIELDKLK